MINYFLNIRKNLATVNALKMYYLSFDRYINSVEIKEIDNLKNSFKIDIFLKGVIQPVEITGEIK